jgi:hypothetical protein
MLKFFLTIGIAGLLAACANTTGSMASRSDGSNPSTMGAPPSTAYPSSVDGVYGNSREPANF